MEDIAPTLLDLVGVQGDPLSTTGQSFAALLRGDAASSACGTEDRVRFTETDLRVLPKTDGGVDEAATAEHNARFFEVDPRSGRMHVRENFVPLVLAFKERAAFTDRLLLAALPAGPDAHQYVLVDKTTRHGASAVGSSRARRAGGTAPVGRDVEALRWRVASTGEHHARGLADHRRPSGTSSSSCARPAPKSRR